VLLASIDLTGAPVRVTADQAGAALAADLVGVDVARTEVDGVEHTVVQVLLDDDRVGFDPTLLEGPLLVEVVRPDGTVVAREPADHDRFRRELQAERGSSHGERRGVLLLTAGELPPPWIRLAFLPIALHDTSATVLRLQRSTVAELLDGVERAAAAGAMSDADRRAALIAIEHLHPPADPTVRGTLTP
jgi:hypothetical protein